MNERYAKMFERTRINSMELSNRYVMAPVTTFFNMDQSIDDNTIDYYEARAKGGVGMIIVETQYVALVDPATMACTYVNTPEQKRMFNRIATRLKGYNTKLCIQLSCGPGRNLEVPGMESVGPSEIPLFANPEKKTRALTIDEIHSIVEGFGDVSLLAKEAGLDAVEIHAHAGYLMDTFISECFNHRTDEYGGSFENRMRLPKEVIENIRAKCGPDFPIIFRFSPDHKVPGRRTMEEGLEIVKYLDKIGVDAFDIDDGCYDNFPLIFPPAYMGDACLKDNAVAVKSVTDKPVLNTGNYTPETSLAAVEEGATDYVMFGRGLVADPEIVNKIYDGRLEDIRPCIRCNQFCFAEAFNFFQLGCGVNAQTGYEKELAFKKTENPKKVVVIGAGPGGMEAARVAATQGHAVTVYEKSNTIGGQAVVAATAEFKTQLSNFIKYLKTQCDKLGVEFKFNTEITADSAELKEADEIIVAVGAEAFCPKIPGLDVADSIDVLDAHLVDPETLGQNIVITGGGQSGCDFALEMLNNGKNVTIIEMAPEILAKAEMNSKIMLTTILMQKAKVMTNTQVVAFEKGKVIVKSGDETITIPADSIVTAFGTKPRKTLADSITKAYPKAKLIGDCDKVGIVGHAVRAGFHAAWTID